MRDWPDAPKGRFERAVFLDRDGTINMDTYYPHDAAQLQMIPEALEGLKLLAALPLHLIVVTNQGGIALGLFRRDQMSEFHAAIRGRTEQVGGRLDGFYYCPHLEPKNLPPGVSPCECAKPAPGLLEEAAREFGLDLSRCFMVGDKTSDVAAGNRAGCRSILVRTGKGGDEEFPVPASPSHVADDLYEAAVWIRSQLEAEQ